jgi:hypothetical protein
MVKKFKEKREKKQSRKKQIFLALFIVAIMSLSILGFLMGESDSNKVKYGNYTFIGTNQGWQLTINKQNLFFQYVPQNVGDINISSDIATVLKVTPEIDITSDASDRNNQSIALLDYELQKASIQTRKFYVRSGFTTNVTGVNTILRCENSTGSLPIIYIKTGNETRIYYNGVCIVMEARSGQEFLRLKDRILYTILGVMN